MRANECPLTSPAPRPRRSRDGKQRFVPITFFIIPAWADLRLPAHHERTNAETHISDLYCIYQHTTFVPTPWPCKITPWQFWMISAGVKIQSLTQAGSSGVKKRGWERMRDSQQQTQGEMIGMGGQEGHLSPFKPTLLASGDPGRGGIV